jgi:hypothetical protein
LVTFGVARRTSPREGFLGAAATGSEDAKFTTVPALVELELLCFPLRATGEIAAESSFEVFELVNRGALFWTDELGCSGCSLELDGRLELLDP